MRAALLTVLMVGATCLIAQDTKVEAIGKSPTEAKFASGGKLRMELCSSGVEVVGEESNILRVEYDANRGNDVKVRIQVSGDHADLRVSSCPHNNFQVRIEVPKSSDLYVRMMAGQLDVRDVTGDKDIALSFGQLNLDVGKTELYARVNASVNSGELNASAFSVDKGGLFRSFSQSGPGKYRLRAHVGAGELDLR